MEVNNFRNKKYQEDTIDPLSIENYCSEIVSSIGRQAFLFSRDLQRKPVKTGLLKPGPTLQESDRKRPMPPNIGEQAPPSASSSRGGDDTNRSFNECLRIESLSFFCNTDTCPCRRGGRVRLSPSKLRSVVLGLGS